MCDNPVTWLTQLYSRMSIRKATACEFSVLHPLPTTHLINSSRCLSRRAGPKPSKKYSTSPQQRPQTPERPQSPFLNLPSADVLESLRRLATMNAPLYERRVSVVALAFEAALFASLAARSAGVTPYLTLSTRSTAFASSGDAYHLQMFTTALNGRVRGCTVH